MKTLGLVGGTGWISSVEYYRLINEAVNKKLGGLEFAKLILYSFNYAEIYKLYNAGKHDSITAMVLDASQKLIESGAEGILLCANTLHFYAPSVEKKISVPIIHIADATGEEIKKQILSKVGLLGTRTTMEEDFYKSKLADKNISTLIPEKDDRELIHSAIMNELLKGIFLDETKAMILRVMNDLREKGAEGIILGCTEIPLIIKQDDLDLPLFDTLYIHAEAAANFIIGG